MAVCILVTGCGAGRGSPAEPRSGAAEELDAGVGLESSNGEGSSGRDEAAVGDLGSSEGPTLNWVNTIGSRFDEYAAVVDDLPNGDVVVAGVFSGRLDLDPGPGSSEVIATGNMDVFVVRLGASGDVLWSRGFGGPGRDRIWAVATDEAGNVILGGDFESEVDFDPGVGSALRRPQGAKDLFVLKLDPEGNLDWVHTFGGVGEDHLTDLETFPDSSIVVVGYFFDTVDFGVQGSSDSRAAVGGRDVFVTRIDPRGRPRWTQTFGGAGEDLGNCVAVNDREEIYIGGRFNMEADFDPGPGQVLRSSEYGADDAFVLALDGQGHHRWVRVIDGIERQTVLAIAATEGRVVASGTFDGTLATGPGGVPSEGRSDIFFTSFETAAGTVERVETLGGLGDESIGDLELDADGGLLATGGFAGKLDFAPGEEHRELECLGPHDGFILRLEPDLTLDWVWTVGGDARDFALGVVSLEPGSLVVVGGFNRTVDFDPSLEVEERNAAGYIDIFTAQLSY